MRWSSAEMASGLVSLTSLNCSRNLLLLRRPPGKGDAERRSSVALAPTTTTLEVLGQLATKVGRSYRIMMYYDVL